MSKRNRKRNSSGGNPRRKVTKAEAYGEIRREFLQILREYETAIVDRIHERLDIPDSALMLIGSAIGSLSRDGLIVRVEFAQTERGKAHGRHVSVWRLAKTELIPKKWTHRPSLTASKHVTES